MGIMWRFLQRRSIALLNCTARCPISRSSSAPFRASTFQSRGLLALATLSVFLVEGCVVPVPGPEPEQRGRVIASKDTVFLEPGRTGKPEVVERLGSPDVIWETENVLVYHSNRVVGRVLWAVPFGYAASVGLSDVSEKHVLLIDFDNADVVHRFELVERGAFESLGELLRRWHKAPGKEPL